MEASPVGQANPYTDIDIISINTGLSGQWKYSPKFRGAKLIASAVIRLTGKRRLDYTLAERITNAFHFPRHTVWHHVYDYNDPSVGAGNCTMQLVSWNDHLATLPHTGGCCQYAVFNRCQYKAENPNTPEGQALSQALEAIEPLEAPAYSKREMDEFCLRTGLKLSPAQRALYAGERRFSRRGLQAAAQRDFWLDDILPLTADDGGASVESIALAAREWRDWAPVLGNTVAVDACGNTFSVNPQGGYLFFDHEVGQFFNADQELLELMEPIKE